MNDIYKDKRVLIFGLGVNQGGLGSARFFASQGARVRVTDLKSKEQLKSSIEQLKEFNNIEYILGEHKNEDIDWADLIIKNQGVKPGNPYMEYAKEIGKEIETDMGIFLRYVSPDQIVGITGTKGKSTTSSLIYEVLKQGNGNVVFAGNIGKSVLDTIPFLNPGSILVLEISSFQLEAFDKHKISPKFAVITNITPDHLDYYNNFEEYVEAKRIIAKYQTVTDYLFLNKSDQVTKNSKFREGLKAKIMEFSIVDLPEEFRPFLPGEHNLINMSAALRVSEQMGIDKNLALEIMADFKGVEFRLQLIKDWDGIKIYNDTAATGPTATIQALNSLRNIILIVGGIDKGLEFEQLAKVIERKAKAVYFIEGSATDKLKTLINHQKILRSTYSDFEDLLRDIKIEAKKGDSILLSPAAASFNLFQNEFDRGRKFNAAVEKVFKDER